MKVSILVPVYNEKDSIEKLLKKIEKIKISKEIIVINDGSDEKTTSLLKELKEVVDMKVVEHKQNRGKGAAVRTGLEFASGDIILVQDADLEYHPEDYLELIKPIKEGEAKVVYGSRLRGSDGRGTFIFYWGGRFLTFIGNLLFSLNLTDITTGYKVFERDVLVDISLERDGFEFCEEVTAKLIKNGYKIKEVPIQYSPRKYTEGKKLRPWDGLIGLWTLVFYKFFWKE